MTWADKWIFGRQEAEMPNSDKSICAKCRKVIFLRNGHWFHSQIVVGGEGHQAEPISDEASPSLRLPNDLIITDRSGTGGASRKMDLVSGPHDEGISLPDPQELLEDAGEAQVDVCAALRRGLAGGASTGEQPRCANPECGHSKSRHRFENSTRGDICTECRCNQWLEPVAARPVSGPERPCAWPFDGVCQGDDAEACLKANRCLKNLPESGTDALRSMTQSEVHNLASLSFPDMDKRIEAALAAPEVQSRLELLEKAAAFLEMMYEKWENGDPSFSESGDSLGNAFQLGSHEDQIIDVLDKLFPRGNAPVAQDRTK